MAVPVRINEDNYVSLKSIADRERRSVTAQLAVILDEYFKRDTVGTPTVITPPPEKTEPIRVETPGEVIDNAHKGIESVAIKRTKGDVLADIRKLEADRDEELRYCQDAEIGGEITRDYQIKIDVLWAEYKGLIE